MSDFVNNLSAGMVRKGPLGPVTMNTFHRNIEVIDALARREHFADGEHNALEIPWVVGHVGSATTGYLFDTAYGGGTIARPGTGRATVSVVSGVIDSLPALGGVDAPAASIIANPAGSDIGTYPQVVEVEAVSATSIETRLWRMTSTLGSPGNSWSLHVEGFDLAVHAQQQPVEASLLGSHLMKVRRDFLTGQATDWNALVRNQAIAYKALSLEHASTGEHSANRIAKAVGWFRPSYTGAVFSKGVSSVSTSGTGIVEVTISTTLASTNAAACFPQAQPASADELVIVCGRCTATTKFTFYIYVYSVAENKWSRADRPFWAAMFGDAA